MCKSYQGFGNVVTELDRPHTLIFRPNVSSAPLFCR